MLASFCTGLSSDEWMRVAAGKNHAAWVVGHIAVTRCALARRFDKKFVVNPWEAEFVRESKPREHHGATAEELLQIFYQAGHVLRAAFLNLSAEDAALPLGRTFPDGSSTVGEGARFLMWHEMYHLGQLGLIRQALGKPGVV